MSEKKLSEIYKALRMSKCDEKGNPMGVNKLAKLTGIASSRISELENGKREMSLTELKVYHSFFNVSFEYLLGETEYESTDMIVLSVSERTGLSENAINLIRQTPYDSVLSDFLETELTPNGVISLIIEYLVNTPYYGKRLIMSKNGDVRFDETEEMVDYNELFDIGEIRTNELYKTLMFNKILSRILYIQKNDKKQILSDDETSQEWRERAIRRYVADEVFFQNYTPTPIEETDLGKALQAEIEKEVLNNANHNPKKE